ncbi:serine/threonine protein phosphatase [Aliishimia ponticola]|uniref:Serine/threonine protein phosphatase n=1 Tax=Aliishimia ponticola TaxID=2499833 RepID=A0A4S4N832_9RHOB|nr:metallophosphoesterase family protein [Aliishimia ponticola]THH35354.1 serine/threonine protein phosphatase [Aliishimia ponticola]
MTPIYAVGDIHGQRAMLDTALERIEQDGGSDARVVFLGDYVDRGPDSKGVIDVLSAGLDDGRNWVCLKGNHDRMFEWFMQDEPRHDPHLLVGYHWFHERIGGIETMASYGVTWSEHTRLQAVHANAQDAVPPEHLSFLQNLHTSHEEAGHLFVHAGLRPGIPLHDQTEEDFLWIRGEFHDAPTNFPFLVVHGHTPVERATHYGTRVNLDTGAGYGNPLTIACFEGDACFTLTSDGRQRLAPVG